MLSKLRQHSVSQSGSSVLPISLTLLEASSASAYRALRITVTNNTAIPLCTPVGLTTLLISLRFEHIAQHTQQRTQYSFPIQTATLPPTQSITQLVHLPTHISPLHYQAHGHVLLAYNLEYKETQGEQQDSTPNTGALFNFSLGEFTLNGVEWTEQDQQSTTPPPSLLHLIQTLIDRQQHNTTRVSPARAESGMATSRLPSPSISVSLVLLSQLLNLERQANAVTNTSDQSLMQQTAEQLKNLMFHTAVMNPQQKLRSKHRQLSFQASVVTLRVTEEDRERREQRESELLLPQLTLSCPSNALLPAMHSLLCRQTQKLLNNSTKDTQPSTAVASILPGLCVSTSPSVSASLSLPVFVRSLFDYHLFAVGVSAADVMQKLRALQEHFRVIKRMTDKKKQAVQAHEMAQTMFNLYQQIRCNANNTARLTGAQQTARKELGVGIHVL